MHGQVGMTNNSPNKDAVLDLNPKGTVKQGLVLPKVRLTNTSTADPLTAHTAGMHVYNIATNGSGATAVSPGEYYNDGSKWIAVPSSAWFLTGNNVTDSSTNFIGTTDAIDLTIRTNNTERMRVSSAGKLLIGTTTVPTGGTNAKVIINSGTTPGGIQIIDGTQATGKVLTSDLNGLATWKDLNNMGDMSGQWNLEGTMTFSTTGNIESGTTSISPGDEIGLIMSGDNGVFVPAGRYIVTYKHDIAANEVGKVELVTNTGTTLWTNYYREYMGGSTFYLQIPAGGYTLQSKFTATTTTPDPIYWSQGFYQPFWTSLSFMKLN
ncbi:hypothetical protein [Flavobacterium sp.]|uniref:hypothetical protein n=1 Tax=Flavobacterium sp. TaxID=239 RepID=UPI002EDB6781